MKKFLILSTLLAVAGLAAGGVLRLQNTAEDKTARLEAEVAALKTQVTATTTPAPTTTTVTAIRKQPVAMSTPTTVTPKVVTTTTTTRPPVTTTTAIAAPWCSARALASPALKGSTQTIYVTSNLPGRVADVNLKPVPMDAAGTGQVSFPSPGGQMDQYGHVSPKTVTVRVRFYTAPWTLNDVLDGPSLSTLMSCSTTYQAIG